jgi:FAD synthase
MNFLNFVRHDVKFSSLEGLKEQLAQDKLDVMKLLNSL